VVPVAEVADPDGFDLGKEDALELDLETEPARQHRRWSKVLYVGAAAFVGLVAGLTLMFILVVNSSNSQRSATCAVIAASRAEKQAQLQQYEESPPSTELARRLQSTYKESLRTWDGLWSTLGCKDTAPPAP
jgi:hypothetical protein